MGKERGHFLGAISLGSTLPQTVVNLPWIYKQRLGRSYGKGTNRDRHPISVRLYL